MHCKQVILIQASSFQCIQQIFDLGCVKCVQIIGALIVAAGVCLAAAPSDAGANIFQQVTCFYHVTDRMCYKS